MRGEGWPVAGRGQSVGLLGGSFDPAHGGHAHITREALKRFGLDWVWWLVSPGNPLKPRGPAPLPERLARARAVMDHPRVKVTDLELRLGTRYTARTLAALGRCYPGVRFVWLMGADNLAEFHHWDRWHDIIETVPVGVLARPGQGVVARGSVTAEIYRAARLDARAAVLLPRRPAPCWCFVNMPMRRDSSTAIRAGGGWPQGS